MNRVDHQISTQALLATVEFKAANGIFTSSWLITGIGKDNLPCLALSVSVPLLATSEASSIAEANQLFESYLEPLALKSLSNGGLSRSTVKGSDSTNTAFELHAKHFEESIAGRPVVNDTFVTAGLYLLAKLLEVKKPIDFLTSFMRLPESTISRRLTKARDSGLIAKRNEGPDG